MVASNGHHRSNAVPAMAVERLRIVAEEVGGSSIGAPASRRSETALCLQEIGDGSHRLDPGIVRDPGEDLAHVGRIKRCADH